MRDVFGGKELLFGGKLPDELFSHPRKIPLKFHVLLSGLAGDLRELTAKDDNSGNQDDENLFESYASHAPIVRLWSGQVKRHREGKCEWPSSIILCLRSEGVRPR